VTRLRLWLPPIIATIGSGMVFYAVVTSSRMTAWGRATESAFLVLLTGLAWFFAWRGSRGKAPGER
jgi:hypothetical protein